MVLDDIDKLIVLYAGLYEIILVVFDII